MTTIDGMGDRNDDEMTKDQRSEVMKIDVYPHMERKIMNVDPTLVVPGKYFVPTQKNETCWISAFNTYVGNK